MTNLENFLSRFSNDQMVQLTIEYCAVDKEYLVEYSEFCGVESISVSGPTIDECIENLKLEINKLDLLGDK